MNIKKHSRESFDHMFNLNMDDVKFLITFKPELNYIIWRSILLTGKLTQVSQSHEQKLAKFEMSLIKLFLRHFARLFSSFAFRWRHKVTQEEGKVGKSSSSKLKFTEQFSINHSTKAQFLFHLVQRSFIAQPFPTSKCTNEKLLNGKMHNSMNWKHWAREQIAQQFNYWNLNLFPISPNTFTEDFHMLSRKCSFQLYN